MNEQLHLALYRMRVAELARAAELRRLAAAHSTPARADRAGHPAVHRRPRRPARHRLARRAARRAWGLPEGASHAWFA